MGKNGGVGVSLANFEQEFTLLGTAWFLDVLEFGRSGGIPYFSEIFLQP